MNQTRNEEKETVTLTELKEAVASMGEDEFMMAILFGGEEDAGKYNDVSI